MIEQSRITTIDNHLTTAITTILLFEDERVLQYTQHSYTQCATNNHFKLNQFRNAKYKVMEGEKYKEGVASTTTNNTTRNTSASIVH